MKWITVVHKEVAMTDEKSKLTVYLPDRLRTFLDERSMRLEVPLDVVVEHIVHEYMNDPENRMSTQGKWALIRNFLLDQDFPSDCSVRVIGRFEKHPDLDAMDVFVKAPGGQPAFYAQMDGDGVFSMKPPTADNSNPHQAKLVEQRFLTNQNETITGDDNPNFRRVSAWWHENHESPTGPLEYL